MGNWWIRFLLPITAMTAMIVVIFGTLLYQLPSLGHRAAGLVLFMSIFYLLLIAWLITYLRRHLKPLMEIQTLIKELAEGQYWRRLYPSVLSGLVHTMARDVNRLAEQLQKMTERQHLHADRLQAIIQHMASGLLFIDEKGRIVLTNQKLLELLRWADPHHGQLYYESPLPGPIVHMIQNCFNFDRGQQQTVTITVGIDRIDLNVLVAPVLDASGHSKGFVIVFHDITLLRRLERTRRDFVANVSHELKTPITSIKGFAETLLDGAMYNEAHLQQFLTIIHRESDRLHRLVEELLELSQIEERRFKLEWKEINLVELLRDSLQVVKGEAEEKGIQLRFTPSLEKTMVEADPDRLQQIAINLLSNAIRYTPEQGKVELSISPWEDKGYCFCVADTGIGLKKEEIPRIFERFYRVDRARSRASGGTGLGLAIVKHLVEAHKGEIWVTSQPGQGSIFCVGLHARPHQQKVQSAQDEINLIEDR